MFRHALVAGGAAAMAGALGSAAAQTFAPRAALESFEAVRAALSAVSFSDRENGEILGTAFDIVERPDVPGRQAAEQAGGAAQRLGVILAPGALDKLRRSSEFRREAPVAMTAGSPAVPVYVRDGPPAIRVTVTEAPVRAIIDVFPRP